MKQTQGNQQDKNARTARGLAVSRTSASKKFGKYKKEEEKAVRKPEVKEDRILKQLKRAWKNFKFPEKKCFDEGFFGEDGHQIAEYLFTELLYSKAESCIKKVKYSPLDVEKFSLALWDFQQEPNFASKAGIFLSAMINNGQDTEYIIHTNHLSKMLDLIGFRNSKNIIVNGNVGRRAGCLMRDGSFIVKGNAGNVLGDGMVGGRIVINGDAEAIVGDNLVDGEIVVEGNIRSLGRIYGGRIRILRDVLFALAELQESIRGGEIHIEGNLPDPINADGEMQGEPIVVKGKIYHKGKLIVDK